MRHRRQRGLSLIELIAVNAVLGFVMLGLTGVIFAASSNYSRWVERVGAASTGDWLGVAVQADTHRYLPCAVSTQRLDLCYPGNGANLAVRYSSVGSGPYDVVRQDPGGQRTTVAHRLLTRPQFDASCGGNSVSTGFVRIGGLRYAGDLTVRPSVVIHFRAPLGATCGNANLEPSEGVGK